MILPQRWTGRRDRLPLGLIAMLVFVALIALAGGTSRPDSLSQILVRLFSILAIAGWLVVPGAARNGDLRLGFALLGAIAILMLVQLIPLPPLIWEALPGRAFYRESALAAGVAQPWRPIALVPDRAWNSFFVLLVPLAALVGLSQMSSRRRATLLLPMAILALASAVLGLAQLSGGQGSALRAYEHSSDSFASGFFANRNHQALLLACALPMLAAWATLPDLTREAQRVRGYVALGVAAFILMMLPTTGSRAGLALAVIGLLASIAFAAPRIRSALREARRRQRRRWAMIAGGGAAVFLGVLIFFGRNEAVQRLYGMDLNEDLRARTFPIVFDMAGRFFPAGTGFGGFDIVYRRFEPFGQLSYYYLNQAHNDLLQVVIEGGIAGAAILLAVLLWWGIASWRAWTAAPSTQRQAARAGSVVVAMAFLASAFDYPLRTPLMMVVVSIAAAWLLVPAARSDAPARMES